MIMKRCCRGYDFFNGLIDPGTTPTTIGDYGASVRSGE